MSLRGRRHGGNANQSALIFTTTCGKDDQFSSPKQIRWSTALRKLLVANSATTVPLQIRNVDLSYAAKRSRSSSAAALTGVDSDASDLYWSQTNNLYKSDLSIDGALGVTTTLVINSIRMIDASGDPDYVYVTSNNATDGHGVRKVRKSDMTVVASILSTGSGDGQFNNPLGVKYYGGYVYVADLTNNRIVRLDSDLTNPVTVFSTIVNLYDLDTNGTNWFISYGNGIAKKDMSWNAVSSIAAISYSLCIIPDQGDGRGQTLAITDATNSHLARYKCSDLSLINEVGSSGDGSASLFDPVITGVAGTWFMDDGSTFAVASGANISWNGLSGYTWKNAGPHRAVFRPGAGGLAAITGIDSNSDLLSGNMKNLYKCVNLTSLKLQTNPALVLNLGQLTSKLQTVWAYACGEGISGSIRHMRSATSINLRENGASQTQVDQWISDLYANKDIMAAGTANFNGNNAAPSAAGKAQADELINDYSWTIAYTP